MLAIRQGLCLFLVFCFQQLGANFVYQVVQDARRKYDEEQQQNYNKSYYSLGDNDDFLLANETIMKALDPILVLRPSSRHGYNYDMIVIHLSECDIYYAKRLKDVPHKMTFSEFNERYENQNYIVIARVKDYEDENFGIYRRRNSNEIKWIRYRCWYHNHYSR